MRDELGLETEAGLSEKQVDNEECEKAQQHQGAEVVKSEKG